MINLQPPFSNLIEKTRKKTASRKSPHKVSCLLLTQSLGQSATAPVSNVCDHVFIPDVLWSPSTGGGVLPATLPMAPALAVPGGEARVDEVTLPRSSARPVTQPVPSASKVLIELSNEDKLEDLAPLVGPIPIALASTAAPASVASTALYMPGHEP